MQLLSQEFGYGKTFPFTLMVVPPVGVSALSVPAFNTVAEIIPNLVNTEGVDETSVADFASVAYLAVRAGAGAARSFGGSHVHAVRWRTGACVCGYVHAFSASLFPRGGAGRASVSMPPS